MPVYADDSVMDAALDQVATATNLTVCAGAPTDFSDISNHALASITLTAGDGNGDYTHADGDTNGRKTTVTQQADLSITTSGDADHVVLDDGAKIIEQTTTATQPLTSGGTVTVNAWDVEFADPVAE